MQILVDQFLEKAAAWASAHWEVSLFSVLFLCFYQFHAKRMVDENGPASIFVELHGEEAGITNASAVYRQGIGGVLNRIDAWLPASNPASPHVWRTAWSGTLYDKCLRLAVAYPFICVLFYWLITGEAGRIVDVIVVPREPSPSMRIFTVIGIALFSGSLIAGNSEFGWRGWVLGAVAFSFAFAGTGIEQSAFADAAAFAAAFSIAIAVAFAGAFSVSIAAAAAFAFTFASAASTNASFAVAFATSGAVVLAGSVALIIEIGRNKVIKKLNSTMYCYLFSTVLTFFMIYFGAFLLKSVEINDTGKLLIVFLSLFPLVNAVFDFFSFGLTRFALRSALITKSWSIRGLISVGTAFVALLCPLALGCAMIFGVHSLSLTAKQELFNIQDLFDGIASYPSAYWWLYLTLFSPFLPTVAHLVLWWVSLGFTRFEPLNRAMIVWLENREKTGDELWSWLIGVFLPLQLTFFTGIAIIGVVYATQYFSTYYPVFGYYFLWFFESFAQLIGAAVVPTPVETRLLMDV